MLKFTRLRDYSEHSAPMTIVTTTTSHPSRMALSLQDSIDSNNSLSGILHLCQCQQCDNCQKRSDKRLSESTTQLLGDIGPEDTLPSRLLRNQRVIYKRRTNPSIRSHKPLTIATSRSHSMNAADYPSTSTTTTAVMVAPTMAVEESPARNGSLNKRTSTPVQLTAKTSTFILDFEDLGLGLEPDSIVSQPGTELRHAVQSAFDKRHLSLEKHHVFLKNSNTPLPWQGHVECLDGQTVLIRVKDASPSKPIISHPTLRATQSGSLLNRRPPNRHSYMPHSNSRSPASNNNNSSTSEWFLPPNEQPAMNSTSTGTHSGMANNNNNNNSINGSVVPSTISGGTNATRTRRKNERPSIITLFKSEKQLLEDKLNAYNNQLPLIETLFLRNGVDIAQKMSELNCVESSWKDISTDNESLSQREKDQQAAVWELIVTEKNHIGRLITLLQFYMVFLETKDHMGEIKAEMVFGNIVDVFLATLNFWRIGLEPMLTEARRHRASCDPSLMGRAFEDISGILQPYYDYQILHEERAKKISHVMGKNENFQQFIHWAEKQEDSGRHKFKDLLSEPCTRLFKYTLLLERIAKYTRDAVVSSALQKMLVKTKDFLQSIDFGKGFKDNFDLLTTIMATIESYDYIEFANEELAKICRNYTSFNLTSQMLGCPPHCLRQLFRRGSLKLKDGGNRTDVFCFLFTDMFLIGKSVMRKADKVRIRIIREPYYIDRILLCPLETEGLGFIYLNEFHVATAAFTLQGANDKENQVWLECFKSAKDSYLRHKSESSKLSWHAPMERSFIPTFPLEKPTEIQVVRNVPSVLTRRNSSSTPAIDIDIPQDRLNDCLPIVHGRSASMDVTLLSSVQQSQEQQEIQVNHSDVPSDSDCSSNHSSRTLKPADNTVTAEHNYEMFTRGNKDSPHTSSIYVKSGKHSVRKRPSPHRSGPKRTPLKRYSSVAPTVIIPTTTANGGCQSAPMRVPTEELLNDFGPEIFSVPPVIEDTDGMQKAEDNEESPDEYRTPPNTRPVSEEIEPRPCSEVFQPYIFDEIRRGSESKLTLEEDINRLQIFDSTQLPPDEPTLKCNEEEFSSPPENFTGNFTVESDSTNEQRTETLGELIFTTDDYHHPSLTEQRSYSPFGKTIVPSPIFCSTVSCDYDSSPMADGYVSSPVSQRNSDDDYHIPLVESDRNLTSTPPPPPPPSVPPPLPQTSEGFGTAQQRRIDRRYHTADAIEPLKSVRGDPICKRHSWNISSACRTTTTFPTQTHFNCLSSESFCSSSGVSSSDSQLCVFSTQSIGIDSIQNGYVSSVSISDDFDSSPPGDTTPQQSRKDINHNRMDDGNKLIVNEEFLTRDELIHFLSKGQVESSDV